MSHWFCLAIPIGRLVSKVDRGAVVPEISVVIPTKDRLELLKQSIPMFLSYDEVKEVIVVADGCRDGTTGVPRFRQRERSRIRYVVNEVNRGVSYSRNRGIELARCDYIFTAEDDLELSDNFFTVLFGHMQESGADIISARNIFQYGRRRQPRQRNAPTRLTGPFIDRRRILVKHEMDYSGRHGPAAALVSRPGAIRCLPQGAF